jgi:hypothetical protein
VGSRAGWLPAGEGSGNPNGLAPFVVLATDGVEALLEVLATHGPGRKPPAGAAAAAIADLGPAC